MSKKYLDTVGLSKLVANILSKFATKNHSHSNATTNSAGFMSSSDKVKLDGVAAGANKTIVDSSLNGTSTNPIQNKAVKTALDGKAASSHTHPTAQITGLDSALAGKASASHKHDAGDITSGVLPIGRGGTGGTTAKSAQHNMLADMNEVTDSVNDNTTVLSSYISSSASTGSVYKRKLSTLWPWIKSKTDPLYATRTHNHDSAYAAKSHNHDAGNITSGVLPIGRGGTGGDSITAAAASLKYYPLGDKTSIPENADLNTYKTAGVYVCPLDSRAQTIKNCPTGGMSFSLEVDYVIAADKYPIQTLRQYNNAKVYKRLSNDSGTTWSEWRNVVMSDDTISIQHGGTGATTAARAVANLFPKVGNLGYVATIGSDWSGGYRSYNDLINDTWSIIKSKTDPLYQPKGSYAAASHTHSIANITNLQSQLDGKQPKGSYAASSHTHTISNVTNLQTELDKKQVKQTPVTTSGTGSAYTANVPHIKSLTAGMKFTMIPNVVSTAVSPTLNVNNLGAKPIRQRLSNSTQSTATGATENWLAAGKPVEVMYDGQFWVVDFVRPNMASAYGTLPVANGGVPSCTTSDNGKFLRVVNGVATWVTIPSAEGVKF